MTRSKLTILDKINQSEARIKQLITERKEELLDIILKYNALAIDNTLLTGFLIFSLNPANKNHSILENLREVARLAKTPSAARKQSNQHSDTIKKAS